MFSIKYAAKNTVFTFITLLICQGCSLNYGTEQNSEAKVAEFTFTNASFIRYEENKMSINLKAEKLEQYKTDGSSYAKNAEFKTYDKDGVLDTDGFCSLLAADTKNETYSLFDGISVHIYSKEMLIKANTLHYNGKTEQLTSGIDEDVTIERKDTSVTGTGFAASGVNRQFSFSKNITGTVKEKQDSESEAEERDEYHRETAE